MHKIAQAILGDQKWKPFLNMHNFVEIMLPLIFWINEYDLRN